MAPPGGRVSLIAAVSDNRVIGRNGQLPWHLPADLARFRRHTMGHHVIVGRRTWESIGRPLPGRTMVVLSRDPDFAAADVLVAHSLEEALALSARDRERFVAGGAEVFRQALAVAGRCLLTRVHAEVDGDAYFPPLDRLGWRLVTSERRPADRDNRYGLTFVELERAVS